MRAFAGVMVALACLSAPHAQADDPIILRVVDNSIPDPLTSQPGDPAEGRKVMLDRRLGNCVSCHQVSALSEADFQGDIGPSLDGVGKRYTTAQLRRILAKRHIAKGRFLWHCVWLSGLAPTNTSQAGRSNRWAANWRRKPAAKLRAKASLRDGRSLSAR